MNRGQIIINGIEIKHSVIIFFTFERLAYKNLQIQKKKSRKNEDIKFEKQ